MGSKNEVKYGFNIGAVHVTATTSRDMPHTALFALAEIDSQWSWMMRRWGTYHAANGCWLCEAPSFRYNGLSL